MNKIYIDGIKTRQNIADETHRAFGVKQLCEELGVPTGLVTKYIRQGYGDGQTIIDLIRKGIPFELSKEPVPCRVKKAHTRGKNKAQHFTEAEMKADLIVTGEVPPSAQEQIDLQTFIMKNLIKQEDIVNIQRSECEIIDAVEKACREILKHIDTIHQNAIYKSIFGGEEK